MLRTKSLVQVPSGGMAEEAPRKRKKPMTEAEQWEVRQLIASGVLDPKDYPTFDQDTGAGGLLMNHEDVEEEFEVDINDAEPMFLKGHTSRSGIEMSPIRIVKNPDGSMQRAALTQGALAKERREIRQEQQRVEMDAVPRELSKPWEDPMAARTDR